MQRTYLQGNSNTGNLLPARSRRGRPSKKLSLMEDYHFLRSVLSKPGWSKPKVDRLVAEICGIKLESDERLRFCHRFLSRHSNVHLRNGRGTRATDVILELRRRPEFATESMATAWPVIGLVLSFPKGPEHLGDRIARSLKALGLTRIHTRRFSRGLEAMVSVGTLPPSTNVDALADWYHNSGITGVLKSSSFVLDRLEVSICLFVEAVLSGRVDVARQWQDCAERLMSSTELRRALDEAYCRLFCEEVRSRIFRALLITSFGQRAMFKNSYIGSPLMDLRFASAMTRTLQFVDGIRSGSFDSNSPIPGDEIYPGYPNLVYRDKLFVPWPMTCEELETLERLSKAEGRPQSEIMSRALMLYEMQGDQILFEDFTLSKQFGAGGDREHS